MIKHIFTLLFLLLTFIKVNAQIPASSYVFSAGTTPFTNLTGGTSPNANLLGDDRVEPITLGFNFPFAGGTYSSGTISSNGWISFTNQTATRLTNSLTEAQAMQPVLFFYWDDMTLGSGTASYALTGTAPNRVFVLEYKNFMRLSAGGPMFDVQVRLSEDGTIEYRYKNLSGTHSSITASIGIMDANGTYQSLPSAGANPTPSSTTFTTTISDKPQDAQFYKWMMPQCTNPPTPGTVTIGSACAAFGVNLGVNGGSIGMNQTYTWEYSPNNTTFTAVSGALSNPSYLYAAAANGWVRCKIQCGSGTPVYTTAVQFTMINSLSGAYTIDNSVPTGGTNFNTFNDFVNALECGISGPVVVNVANNATPYTERVTFNNILGTSATNTITIKGNGATLQFNPTATSNMQLMVFNGAKYITVDSLKIKSLSATYGYGIIFTGNAQYDTIRNCYIDLSLLTTSSSANACGIAVTNSLTSPSASGFNGRHLYIANNVIDAGSPSSMYGAYYAMSLYGSSTSAYGFDSSYIINNEIKNFYYYGIYGYYGVSNVIKGNNIHKTTKTSNSSSYGISLYYFNDFDVSNNKIHDFAPNYSSTNSMYPIYLYYPNYYGNIKPLSKVNNNAIYNVGNNGGTFYGIYSYYGDSVQFHHNTIDVNLQQTSGTSTQYGMYLYNITNSYFVKNNNISWTGGNNGSIYGIYCSQNNMFNTNLALNHNNIYINSPRTGSKYRIYYNTNYQDLLAFRTANPTLETNGMEYNPTYLNAATGDLRPGNPNLLQAGENLTAFVPRDINNVLRPNFPTPGAFEHFIPKAVNDLGVTRLVSPQNICAGPNTLTVNIRNFGKNKVLSGRVHWTMDGVAQTPVIIPTMNLDTFRASNPFDTVITLGNYVFNTQPVILKAWTYLPNGLADTSRLNDTLTLTLYPAMSGAYTIDQRVPASATNFVNFTALATALDLRGVCGPVVVNVATGSGPYTDRLLLTSINGSSAINTIRINGNGERMQFNPTSTGDMQLVVFNGTKYTTLNNLHIKTLNTTYGYGVIFTNNAKYDSLTNCNIDLSTVTGSSSINACGIAVTSSLTSPTSSGYNGSNLYIANNIIDGGSPTSQYGAYYAISLYGHGSSTYGFDSSYILNNEIKNYYYYGINAYYGLNNVFSGNNIHKTTKTSTSSTYGMAFNYFNGSTITNNRIHDFAPSATSTNTFYGIYNYYGNYYGTSKPLSNINNNAIYNVGNNGGTFYGIYSYFGDSVNLFHNTVDISLPGSTSTSTMYGMYLYNTTNSYFVKNNNINYTGGNNGTKYGIYNSSSSMYNSNLALQNNNVFMNSSRTGTQYRIYYGSAYANLAAFQAAFPTLETQAMEADPQYLNAANGDYIPMNPLVMMKGENLLSIVPEDIVGSNRPVPPTPGAWDLAPKDYDNTGVDSLITPGATFCAGVKEIRVRVRNFGFNDVDTVTINWTINGQARTSVVNYTNIQGTLASNNNTAIVTLGSEFMAFGRNYEIKAWTEFPNNMEDDYNQDDTLTITVTPTSAIPVNIGNDTTICDNVTFTLVAGVQQGYTYHWDNMGVAPQRIVNQAGIYHVIKTQQSTGCAGVDTIVVSTIPAPVVNLGPDGAVCEGDSFLLDVGAANYGNNILWNDNNTDSVRYVTRAGIYTVTVTSPNGCFTTDEFRLKYMDEPFIDGLNILLALDGSYNLNVRNPQFVQMAIWDYGDGSPNDTGLYVNHRYTNNGLYQVKVYLLSVCGENLGEAKSYTETLDVFDATSIGELDGVSMKLYPNPATDKIYIALDGAQIQQVDVYNVLGQKVQNNVLKFPSATQAISTQQLVSGMYHLHIKTDKGLLIRKVEIVK